MNTLASIAVRRDAAIREAREHAARKWTRISQELQAAVEAAEREYECAERQWWASLERQDEAA